MKATGQRLLWSIVDTDKLVKISTYARQKNISISWVRKLIAKNELTMVIIDGVQFVKRE